MTFAYPVDIDQVGGERLPLVIFNVEKDHQQQQGEASNRKVEMEDTAPGRMSYNNAAKERSKGDANSNETEDICK
ncbi:hypothetical protein QQS21_009203, partial [Conoideocrella luteorostrata]